MESDRLRYLDLFVQCIQARQAMEAVFAQAIAVQTAFAIARIDDNHMESQTRWGAELNKWPNRVDVSLTATGYTKLLAELWQVWTTLPEKERIGLRRPIECSWQGVNQ